MAARADILRDFGENAPENWDAPFQGQQCHVALTIYAVDEAARDRAVGRAMAELEASHGVMLIGTHEFGADEEAKNLFGFRDSIAPAWPGRPGQPRPDRGRGAAGKGPAGPCRPAGGGAASGRGHEPYPVAGPVRVRRHPGADLHRRRGGLDHGGPAREPAGQRRSGRPGDHAVRGPPGRAVRGPGAKRRLGHRPRPQPAGAAWW